MPLIINGQIVTRECVLQHKVLIFDREIKTIKDLAPGDMERFAPVIDAQGAYVIPGLIDIHIHGCLGYEVMDGSLESLLGMSNHLIKQGITSYLPTTLTMPWPAIHQALRVIDRARQDNLPGARVLGAHLEGPFISVEKCGAQNKSYIAEPSVEPLRGFLPTIRVITLAPEEDEDFAFMREIQQVAPHIRLSAGHSQATYSLAQAAIAAGIKGVTHLFNAMPVVHHRRPGLVGAALSSAVYCELIADTFHVHPAWFAILKCLKKERLILVSDAMRAAGLKDGLYDLGGLAVQVKDSKATLEGQELLAGSVIMLIKAVENMVRQGQTSLPEAVNMASYHPACYLGLQHKIGQIAPGLLADLVIVDDQFNIKRTIKEGETVYIAE